MNHIAVMAVCLDAASFMLMPVAMSCMSPVIYDVGNDSDDDGQNEKDSKQYQSLLGNHGQHHESLVTGRSYHHSHQCSKTEKPVCIKGNRGKATHASGDRTHKCTYHHLTDFGLLQSFEQHALGLDVQRFDHHHHHYHKSRNQNAVSQYVYKQMHLIPVLRIRID